MEVAQPFAGRKEVVCSSTPAGLIAMSVHLGPYDRLPEAGRFVGVHSAGLRADWEVLEVYRHWYDDPSKFRTDVHYLVQSIDLSTD